MLTPEENKQLTDAIKCMNNYNLNGHAYVSQQNVLVMVNNFTDNKPKTKPCSTEECDNLATYPNYHCKDCNTKKGRRT